MINNKIQDNGYMRGNLGGLPKGFNCAAGVLLPNMSYRCVKLLYIFICFNYFIISTFKRKNVKPSSDLLIVFLPDHYISFSRTRRERALRLFFSH